MPVPTTAMVTGALICAGIMGVNPRHCIFVGDSAIDTMTVDLVPYQDGTTVKNPATANHMGSPVFKWVCGPGATNPMPAKFLPGSCRGS